MHLPFHRPVHPARLAAAGEHDTQAEEHTAHHCVRAHPEDLGRHAKPDRRKRANAGGGHAQQNAIGDLGAAGGPQVARGAGKTDLPPFDQAAEGQAEQERHPQRERGFEAPGRQGQGEREQAPAQAPLPLGSPRERFRVGQGRASGLHAQGMAQKRQEGDLHPEPGAQDGGKHEGPGVHREHGDAGEKSREVAAHRQTRPEAGDDPAHEPLHEPAQAGGAAQTHVARPQGAAQRPEEHAEHHHAVDAIERRAL